MRSLHGYRTKVRPLGKLPGHHQQFLFQARLLLVPSLQPLAETCHLCLPGRNFQAPASKVLFDQLMLGLSRGPQPGHKPSKARLLPSTLATPSPFQYSTNGKAARSSVEQRKRSSRDWVVGPFHVNRRLDGPISAMPKAAMT